MVPAPTLPGFSQPCWSWNRTFQCVEKNPIHACASGTPYPTVEADCSLSAVAIKSDKTIGGAYFILDADYTYACPFKAFIPVSQLPSGGARCDLMETGAVTPIKTIGVAAAGSEPVSGALRPPAVAFDQPLVTDQKRIDNFVCYSEPVTVCESYCGDLSEDANVRAPNKCNIPASANCVTAKAGEIVKQGPSNRETEVNSTQVCKIAETPSCLSASALANCTLSSKKDSNFMPNGVPTSEEQSYRCQKNEAQPCPDNQRVEVNSCVSVNAWGLDSWGGKTNESMKGFGELNNAMAQLQGLEKGLNPGDLFVFSGADRRCKFAVGSFWNTLILAAVIVAAVMATGGAASALMTTSFSVTAGTTMGAGVATTGVVSVGGTALTITGSQIMGAAVAASALSEATDSKVFGNDCCKDLVVEGSDKWWKLGKRCEASEVKLAIAKRKNLAMYLGEYCSQVGGWLIKSCNERTRSYCVFDDALAMTVNEQGRVQLDQMASADAVSTPEARFPAFTQTKAIDLTQSKPYSALLPMDSYWHLAFSASNQPIYYWKYPFYCATNAGRAQAYEAHATETNKAILKYSGRNPANFTTAEREDYLKAMLSVPARLDCGDPGVMQFLTCNPDDGATCDVARMPRTPDSPDSDLAGNALLAADSTYAQASSYKADVGWKIQRVASDKNPGDVGQNTTMASDPSFAAHRASIHPLITSVGSCKANGDCLYRFDVSQPAASGVGARREKEEVIEFPLYSLMNTPGTALVSYLSKTGILDGAQHAADPLRGKGLASSINGHQFIFRPILGTLRASPMHSHVLLEHMAGDAPSEVGSDYSPILVPTSLPPNSVDWNPHPNGFNLEGGCDAATTWCKYTVKYTIPVTRHPWGDARDPRCWGFTPQQLALFDFSKMDLSRWINSMDLSAFTGTKSDETRASVTDQAQATAENYFSALSTGTPIKRAEPGSVSALILNSDTFPVLKSGSEGGESYLVKLGVTSNWPLYSTNAAENGNPVSKIQVNWGGASNTFEDAGTKSAAGDLWEAQYDVGDYAPGKHKITVQATTANNGIQTLSQWIYITPDSGQILNKQGVLDLTPDTTRAASSNAYNPADVVSPTDGSSLTVSPDVLNQTMPSLSKMLEMQKLEPFVKPATPVAP